MNQSGWITLYIPKVSEFTSGIFPYELNSTTNLVQQPELAAKILQDFVKLNKQTLSKIKSVDGNGTLADFMLSSSKDSKKAQQILDSSLDFLLKSSDRPNVLLALDQSNALYSKTAYNDKDSNPITSDKFEVIQTFLRIISTKLPPRTAVCLSVDNSVTQIRSHYLEKLIAKATPIHIDPLEIKVDRYESLAHVSEFEAILPDKLDSSNKDIFPPNLKEAKIPDLQVFNIPIYDLDETRAILQFYRQSNCLQGKPKFKLVPLTEEEVKIQWMSAQGNPWDTFRGTISTRNQ